MRVAASLALHESLLGPDPIVVAGATFFAGIPALYAHLFKPKTRRKTARFKRFLMT